MKIRLRHEWDVVSSGYWFVPGAMTAAAALVAIGLLYVDRHVIGSGERWGWLYGGGSNGAKTLLSAVAGSVITVAGVVFSITVATLAQTSGQFGPRLLRKFMRDTGNQVVLGTFLATFLYCLLVLRTIHDKIEDGSAFVPQASVTVAVLLAVADVGVLIFFIHHVSASLQAPNVVSAVRAELGRAIDQQLTDQDGVGEPVAGDAAAAALPGDFDVRSRPIAAACDGYVQAVDYAALVAWAGEADLVLRVACRAGDYVIAGTPLVHAYPAERCPAGDAARVNAAFILGEQRTQEQDVEYAIRQLVEVAVRALSPGINDPFTALNCVDALGSAICQIAQRGLTGRLRFEGSGQLRLVVPVTTFAGVVDAAFNQIRQYGRGSVAVTLRLLEVIRTCALQVPCDADRRALLLQAEMVYRQSQLPEVVPEERDRADAEARWREIVSATHTPAPHDRQGARRVAGAPEPTGERR